MRPRSAPSRKAAKGWRGGDLKFFLKGVFLIMPAALIAIIAAAFLTGYLEDHPGYRAFEKIAARTGKLILITAVVVFISDLAAMITYSIRRGTPDKHEPSAIDDGPLPMSLDPPVGRSKRKILVSRNDYVSMESLVSGTATTGERLMALGISLLLASFFSIFLGAGLILMKDNVIAILFPVIPGIWFYNIAHSMWTDYRELKAKLRAGVAGIGLQTLRDISRYSAHSSC